MSTIRMGSLLGGLAILCSCTSQLLGGQGNSAEVPSRMPLDGNMDQEVIDGGVGPAGDAAGGTSQDGGMDVSTGDSVPPPMDDGSGTSNDGATQPPLDGASHPPTKVCLKRSEPLTISGKKDLVISGLQIESSDTEPAIFIIGSENITIENCWIGPNGGEGVKIYQGKNILIRNSYFERVRTGVNAIQVEGVVVKGNHFLNMGAQGERGNIAMFNNCRGGGNRIEGNLGENIEGESSTEDLINLYGSTGLPGQPVIVADNRFRGGGPSQTGGGIMTGDSGGSYLEVRGNILVNPGNYGVAIAGGHHITLQNNRIFQESRPWAHFPAYIWDWESLGDCHDHVIKGNKAKFFNDKNEQVALWYGHNTNCTWNEISDNDWNADLSANILPVPLWETEMPDAQYVKCE